MIDASLLSRVRTLSAAERIELLGAVWESFTATEAPITEEEKRLLEARLSDLAENPGHQSPWREVQARMRQRLP
ncbi:MAG: addiction module protein [Panacagrimonas sp.]